MWVNTGDGWVNPWGNDRHGYRAQAFSYTGSSAFEIGKGGSIVQSTLPSPRSPSRLAVSPQFGFLNVGS